MARKRKFTRDAIRFAYDRHIGDEPEQQVAHEEELANVG